MLSGETSTTTSTTATTVTTTKRLRVRRLFTASSPHLGAMRAERLPQLLRMQKDMTPGSAFYRELEESERRGGLNYEIFPYVRLGDDVVGAQNAAPKGRVAWWVPNPPGEFTHVGAMTDPRILADVVRRLRGESPLTKEPPTPLPVKDSTSNIQHRTSNVE
jgi:hypothetical protein